MLAVVGADVRVGHHVERARRVAVTLGIRALERAGADATAKCTAGAR